MRPPSAKKLPREFYLSGDVVALARTLLGKVLCTKVDREYAAAMITETEAYNGVGDRASHAFAGRRTARTEPMFRRGGVAYVYLCYGLHHLFNVVVGDQDQPLAVLVRAAQPLGGIDIMQRRRGRPVRPDKQLAGPGILSQALGITTGMTGTSLTGHRIWIEDHGIKVRPEKIDTGPRVGVDYAGEDAFRPYRFRLGAGV